MNTLSPGLFGLNPAVVGSLPQFTPLYDPGAMGVPDASAQMPPPGAAPQPFVWGGAGDRLSADDIAQREKTARLETAAGMDFSPVGSWSQGAARVAQALLGGLDQKAADKASSANVTATGQAIASLGQPGGGSEQNIAALLADPSLDQGVRDLAKAKLTAMYKPAPHLEGHAGQLVDEGMTPGTAPFNTRMNAFNTQQEQGTPFVYEQWNPEKHATDKIITTRAAISASANPAAPGEPPAAAISYLQQNPAMASHFDEKYGPGASQRYLTGGAIPSGSATFR